MNSTPLMLGSIDQQIIPIVVITIAGVVVLTLIVFTTVRKMLETRARETTRREIAAYVAEGSITPDDACRLLATGTTEELEKKMGDAVAWGMISPKKAEGLLRAARDSRADDSPASV